MLPYSPSLVVVVTSVGNVNVNVAAGLAGSYTNVIQNIVAGGGIWVNDANGQLTKFALLKDITSISVAQ